MSVLFNGFKRNKKPVGSSALGEPVSVDRMPSPRVAQVGTSQDQSLPLGNPGPKADRSGVNDVVLLELGDFLPSLPTNLLRAGDLHAELPFAVEVQVLARCLAEGRATAPASEIFQNHAEILRDGALARPDLEICCPWRKIQQILVETAGRDDFGPRLVAEYRAARKRLAESGASPIANDHGGQAPSAGHASSTPEMTPARQLNGQKAQEGPPTWFTTQTAKAPPIAEQINANVPCSSFAPTASKGLDQQAGVALGGPKSTSHMSTPLLKPDFSQVPDLMMPSASENSPKATRSTGGSPAKAPASRTFDLNEMPDLTEVSEVTPPATKTSPKPPARDPVRMTARPDFTQVPDLMMPSASESSSEANGRTSSSLVAREPQAGMSAAPASPTLAVAEIPDRLPENTPPAPDSPTIEQARELARVTAERDAAVAQIASHAEAAARERESMLCEHDAFISTLLARHESTISALRHETEKEGASSWKDERAALAAKLATVEANRQAELARAAAERETLAAVQKRAEEGKQALAKEHEDLRAALIAQHDAVLADSRRTHEGALAEARVAEERLRLEITAQHQQELAQQKEAHHAEVTRRLGEERETALHEQQLVAERAESAAADATASQQAAQEKIRSLSERLQTALSSQGESVASLHATHAQALADVAAKHEQEITSREDALEWKSRALSEFEAEVDGYRKRITAVLKERDGLRVEKEALVQKIEALEEAETVKGQLTEKMEAQAMLTDELKLRLEEAVDANKTLISTLIAFSSSMDQAPAVSDPSAA